MQNVKIEWEIDYENVIDRHQHEVHYPASGKGSDGKNYIGTASKVGDEIDIIDIE